MSSSETSWRIVPGKSWGPIELGMSRAQAKAALIKAKAELEEDDEDPTYLETATPWGGFYFEGPSGELTSISIFDAAIAFGEEPLAEPTLDKALTALGGLFPVGKKVEIRYLPEQPDQATTIWEAREHGFVDFIPSMLAAGAIYLGAFAVLSVVVR